MSGFWGYQRKPFLAPPSRRNQQIGAADTRPNRVDLKVSGAATRRPDLLSLGRPAGARPRTGPPCPDSSTIERCLDLSRSPSSRRDHRIAMSRGTRSPCRGTPPPLGHGGVVVAPPSSGVRNRPSPRPCHEAARRGSRGAARQPGTLPSRMHRGHRRPALHRIGHSRTDMAACAHSASHVAAGARLGSFPRGDHDRPGPRRQPGRSPSRHAATACRHQKGWGPACHGDPGDLPPVTGRVGPWIGAGDTRPNRHPGGQHPPQSASGRATPAPIGIRAANTRPDRQAPQLPKLTKVGA